MIYWFVGQPGVGKSTLAKMLKKHFDVIGNPSIHLDGDDLRVIFGGSYKTEHFTKEYRDTNTRKLQLFVEHVEKQGIDVIVSTVNGNRAIREELKARNPKVVEIYVENSQSHVREDRAYADFERPIFSLCNCIVIDTGSHPNPESSFYNLCEKLIHYYEKPHTNQI
jgi:adenylylsulfate kinase-like enzyme